MQALIDVLPRTVSVEIPTGDPRADVIIGGHSLDVKWAGAGSLGAVVSLLRAAERRPDVVAARELSPGAKNALSEAGVAWVDETGAAEMAIGTIIVSRSGTRAPREARMKRWTPAVLGVAEALLCGVDATGAAVKQATGLSSGSCTNALRFLAGLGLLESNAARGRDSARRVRDVDSLLDAYAAAAQQRPTGAEIQVGVTWRDPVAGLAEAGSRWIGAGVSWAATGVAAATVLAPLMTNVTSAEVYVGAETMAGLAAAAAAADLRPIEGGRLTLRPYPTVVTRRLAAATGGIVVVPWPRVFVDVQRTGVRGEEAAEHLREVVRER
ncbi:hypothetical protein [Candidatus Poriferisodalis sp.]|uniref:hypothetical protein n=1 Tax=Candidatus Poriferisodalis sp. TaxID=3101277 RepID=UPI003B01C739